MFRTLVVSGFLAAVVLTDTPDSFDCETRWPDTAIPVLDQQNCGSCYAFATTESLSGRIFAAGGKAASDFHSWGGVLSAETPVAFYHKITDSLDGCQGGVPIDVISTIVGRGIPTVQCLQYLSQTANCGEQSDAADDGCTDDVQGLEMGSCYSNSGNEWTTWGWYSNSYIDSTSVRYLSDEASIKDDVYQYGPMATAFDVYANFFSSFSYCGPGNCPIYTSTAGELQGGHAVLIVGWGSDSRTPYWRIRNSWGSDWAENGYFRFLRGSNLAGIEDTALAFRLTSNSDGTAPKLGNKSGEAPVKLQRNPGAWLEQPLNSSIVNEALAAVALQADVNGRLTLKAAHTQVVAGINVHLVFGGEQNASTSFVVHRSLASMRGNGGTFKILGSPNVMLV